MEGLELFATFSASVVGSLHCIGMCGPFAAVYAGEAERGSEWKGHLTYQASRGAVYVALGALLGGLGQLFDRAGEWLGVLRIAALVSSVLVILWGFGSLFRASKGKALFGRVLEKNLVQLRKKSAPRRGALLGLVTPLLPCGWLYAFLLTAAGTGTVRSGALLMFVFWLGSVPALVGFGTILARFASVLRPRMPLVSSVLLVLVGLSGLVLRAPHFLPGTESSSAPHHCH